MSIDEADDQPLLRRIPEWPGLDSASTLPAARYANLTFSEHERRRVCRHGRVCAGDLDDTAYTID